jgi:hypothetical protein
MNGLVVIPKTFKSAANTAIAETINGSSGASHFLHGLSVCLEGATNANEVTVVLKDNTTVIWEECIGVNSARGTNFSRNFSPHGLKLGLGNPLKIEVGAAGAGAVVVVNLALETK